MNPQLIEMYRKAMRVLKVDDLSLLFGRTNHGDLAYRISKDTVRFTLDSIPVDQEKHDALEKILFNSNV